MIEGLSDTEYGISWSKPTAMFSGTKTVDFTLSETAVAEQTKTVEGDKIFSEVYDDFITLATSLEMETERELKAFSINVAVLTRSLDEKAKRWNYSITMQYYIAV